MLEDGKILIGKSTKPETLDLRLANRHGLITGATGTGKTVSLQVLAEGFSNAGVPVFAADIKGDLSGIAAPGSRKRAFVKRAKELGVDFVPDRFPVVFWDLFGEQGHRVRATVSEMGPLLLSRLLDLNDTQEGVLNIAFRIADEQGLLLLDLKDLRALLQLVADNAQRTARRPTAMSRRPPSAPSSASCSCSRTRRATEFLGEPALDIKDLMRTDRDGRGIVNILAADKLMNNPRLYATFLLWLMSELFEELPEVGDLDKPKLVFFFDEAHLLFNDAPKALIENGRARRSPDPLQGRRRLFHHPEPGRRAGIRAGAARQPGAARASRLYAPGTESRPRGGGDLPPEPGLRHRESDHRTRRRRGSGLDAGGQGLALDGGAHADRAADGAGRPDHRGGAPGDHRGKPAAGQIRADDQFGFGLRNAGETGREGGRGCTGGARRRRHPRHPGRLFGTTSARKGSMTVTQRVTREVTRTVVNQTVGSLAAAIGKSLGGRQGSSIGRAIVRGTLGGLLRR